MTMASNGPFVWLQLPSQLLVSCAKLRTLQVDGNPLEYHYLEEVRGRIMQDREEGLEVPLVAHMISDLLLFPDFLGKYWVSPSEGG